MNLDDSRQGTDTMSVVKVGPPTVRGAEGGSGGFTDSALSWGGSDEGRRYFRRPLAAGNARPRHRSRDRFFMMLFRFLGGGHVPSSV